MASKNRDFLIFKVVREFFLKHKSNKRTGAAENSKDNVENPKEMDFEMASSSENPMSKALRNPLVIEAIIRNSNRSSVLTCLLLNKLWLELCTKYLSKSRHENPNALEIKFFYCQEAKAYMKHFDGLLRGEVKTLKAFNKFLSKLDDRGRSQFPCTNFEFKDLVLDRPQIQKFFQLHGSKIKGLRLDFYLGDFENSLNPKSLTDLFMNKTPNVECLNILSIPLKWSMTVAKTGQTQILNINSNSNMNHQISGPVNENQDGAGGHSQIALKNPDLPIFSLDKLRCLVIELWHFRAVHEILVKEIILSSPALKEVRALRPFKIGENAVTFDYLTAISKTQLLGRVAMTPEVKNLQFLKQFAQSQPRLSSLDLYLDLVESRKEADAERTISFEQLLPFASSLLHSSKRSLEQVYILHGSEATNFLQNEAIPTLENVTSVGFSYRETIASDKGIGGQTAVPAKTFNRIFPNASYLFLNGESGSGGLLKLRSNEGANTKVETETEIETETGTAPQIPQIPQVRRLHLDESFTKEFWLNLPLLFCNLENLVLTDSNPLETLPLIWKLTSLRLKSLDLRIYITMSSSGVVSPALIFPGLDAALTGFPEEVCPQLLSLYPKILDEGMAEELRINSSILDLKHLEKLRIEFWMAGGEQLPECFLTVVSGAYAFQRMKSQQQLQVCIQTQLRQRYDDKRSFLISKNERMVKMLKPLLPFADLKFTIA